MNWHSLIGLTRDELCLRIGQKPDIVLKDQFALDLCPVSTSGQRTINANEYLQWDDLNNLIVVAFLVDDFVVQVQTGSRKITSTEPFTE